ncbi:hypothetical protein H4R34_002272 [Dimargaris verticillata]|uniref:J domain-containing protein n=1 Tax=Dimargaris verticillata TaxID=2761393 RepID=A0A9W8EE86_9FUNG|nr:hypothetical protein H4R34_002272 [Dimargaris verticillata]
MSAREKLHKLLNDEPTDSGVDEDGEVDLYAVLQVTTAATEAQVKHAYRKLALRFHPDKFDQSKVLSAANSSTPTSAQGNGNNNIDNEETLREQWTHRFQRITLAYSILSDPKKRQRYDQTGSVEDSVLDTLAEDGRDWDAYFAEIYKGMVNTAAIDKFAATYRESAEERADLLQAYRTCQGDMEGILNSVPLAVVEDELRFRKTLDAAIKAKEIEPLAGYTAFNKQAYAKRVRAAKREAKEAEALARELSAANGGGAQMEAGATEHKDKLDSLQALIQQRSQQRMGSLIANLEAKYAPKPKAKSRASKPNAKKRTRASSVDEPSEAEFLALQEKLFGKKTKA